VGEVVRLLEGPEIDKVHPFWMGQEVAKYGEITSFWAGLCSINWCLRRVSVG
jgi:hypothetical protein